MALGVFAGIPVRDYDTALEWYKRLFGADPAFYPNGSEAVWQVAEDRYVYIIQDVDRAGGAVSMIWVDDPVAEVARISGASRRREARLGLEVHLPRQRRQRDGNRRRGLDAGSGTARTVVAATTHDGVEPGVRAHSDGDCPASGGPATVSGPGTQK